jgi:hypothetical protein
MAFAGIFTATFTFRWSAASPVLSHTLLNENVITTPTDHAPRRHYVSAAVNDCYDDDGNASSVSDCCAEASILQRLRLQHKNKNVEENADNIIAPMIIQKARDQQAGRSMQVKARRVAWCRYGGGACRVRPSFGDPVMPRSLHETLVEI